MRNCFQYPLEGHSETSEETAKALTFEEENKKLKNTIDRLSKEKTSLVNQMANTTGVTDKLEEKIQSAMQDGKDTLLSEMRDLRANSKNQWQWQDLQSVKAKLPCNSQWKL